jgi:hypothetical protein
MAWLIHRQLRARSLKDGSRGTILLVLGIYGATSTYQVIRGSHLAWEALGVLLGSLVVGAALGAIRAATVKLWSQDGQILRQGTWLTATLWVVAFGLHLLADPLIANSGGPKGLGGASILLYLAITWWTQNLLTQARAEPLRRTSASLRR